MAQYVPSTWADGVAGATPITSVKLNKIEQALVDGDLQNPDSAASGVLATKADLSALAGKADVAAIPTASTLSGATDLAKQILAAETGDVVRTLIGSGTGGGTGNVLVLNPSDPVPSGTAESTVIVRRATAIATEPTRVGYVTQNYNSGVTTATVTPSTSGANAIADGDWMILTYMAASAVTPATPTGWALLNAQAVVGSRTVAIWGKMYSTTDTSYTITHNSTDNGSQANLFWGSGAGDVSTWIVGAGALRANNATPTSCVAPSITTTASYGLVLALSFEASLATATSVTSVTGATEWFFAPEAASPMLHTLEVAYIDKSAAGATPDVTIQYDAGSTNTNNGYAIQIGLLPA